MQEVIALLLLILLVLIWLLGESWRMGETLEQREVKLPLNCRVPGILEKVKHFYDNVGEWRGYYTMDPISILPVDSNNCDVKYLARPVNPSVDPLKKEENVGVRRFTFDWTPEGWQPILMGHQRTASSRNVTMA